MLNRKSVRHSHDPGHLHELTFSCYRRLPLLTNDRWRQRLARALDDANREADVHLVAFVFMPEHVHLLVEPCGNDYDVGRHLARIKQPFSKEIKSELVALNSRLLEKLTVLERPGKTCFRFWQEGSGYDRNLFSQKVIQTSIEYIHRNPVTRGLCQQAVDWKWSSAGFYLNESPGQQIAGLPLIHGISADALP